MESIVRDLADVAVKMIRESEMQKVEHLAEDLAEERILDVLLPQARSDETPSENDSQSTARQVFRKKLRQGELDNKEIEIKVAEAPPGLKSWRRPASKT